MDGKARFSRSSVRTFGRVLLGIALLVAGRMKLQHPSETLTAFYWVPLPEGVLWVAIPILAFSEALVGATVVCCGESRLAMGIGRTTALLFAGGHLATLIFRGESCGCFGRIEVPWWITLSLLVLGFWACQSQNQQSPDGGMWRVRAGAATLCLGVAVFPLLAWRIPQLEEGKREVSRVLSRYGRGSHMGLVVSGQCRHCLDFLDQLEENREAMLSGQAIDGKAVILLSEEDPEVAALRRRYPDFPVESLSDVAWWQLIEERPPAILVYREGRIENVPFENIHQSSALGSKNPPSAELSIPTL